MTALSLLRFAGMGSRWEGRCFSPLSSLADELAQPCAEVGGIGGNRPIEVDHQHRRPPHGSGTHTGPSEKADRVEADTIVRAK